MSWFPRAKDIFGGGTPARTVAAAATLNVPDNAGYVYLTGTDTVTSLVATPSSRGRMVIFQQATGDAGTTTFTNTDNTTTANLMDLGGSNRALAATDVLALYLRQDGSWVRLYNTDN